MLLLQVKQEGPRNPLIFRKHIKPQGGAVIPKAVRGISVRRASCFTPWVYYFNPQLKVMKQEENKKPDLGKQAAQKLRELGELAERIEEEGTESIFPTNCEISAFLEYTDATAHRENLPDLIHALAAMDPDTECVAALEELVPEQTARNQMAMKIGEMLIDEKQDDELGVKDRKVLMNTVHLLHLL